MTGVPASIESQSRVLVKVGQVSGGGKKNMSHPRLNTGKHGGETD